MITRYIRRHILWVPVSPFPHLLVTEPVNAIVAGMEAIHELSKSDFHSQGQQRPTLSPQYGTMPWDKQLPTYRFITLGHFYHGRRGTLFLLEQTLNSGHGFPFLHTVLLPKLSSVDLPAIMVLDPDIPSEQGT